MKPVKYIGMDVHQATISVAVLDERGKRIMECIVETKACTILEFLQGLQGNLSVTFEEGTSAAWLHDLLKPHVSQLVVCDPRKNALLKDGSKSDRIDARKLAELLRGNQLSPVYHGEHGLRPLKELGRSYLTISQDLVRVMVRVKALYRSWAIPCSGKQVYAVRHRAAWLEKIGGRRAATGRVLLSATGRATSVAPGSTPRSFAGERPAPGDETAPPDSFHRADPCRLTDRVAADSASLPYQATVVGLQRLRHRNPRQWRTLLRRWRATSSEEESLGSWAQSKLQSRSQKPVQRRGHPGGGQTGPLARVLRSAVGQRNPARDGAAHLGTKAGHDHFNHVEERGGLRRQTTEIASSLSVSVTGLPSPWILWW